MVGRYVEDGVEVQYLGIWFSKFGSLLHENWRNSWINKMEKTLTGWGGLGLSLNGRVVVLNGYWLPKIWYLAYQIDLPTWVRQKLEKMMTKWIWKGCCAQVGQLEMYGDKEEGGLGLVKLEAKLLALRA